MRAALILGIFSLCFLGACGPSRIPTPIPKETADAVKWDRLVQDFEVARSYSGRLVTVWLEPRELRIDGQEIKVWANDRTVAPVLVFRCVGVVPSEKPLCVMGRCGSPVRDGIWRSPRQDFSLTVSDCLVTAR